MNEALTKIPKIPTFAKSKTNLVKPDAYSRRPIPGVNWEQRFRMIEKEIEKSPQNSTQKKLRRIWPKSADSVITKFKPPS